jgi:FkbM family methyltransferase
MANIVKSILVRSGYFLLRLARGQQKGLPPNETLEEWKASKGDKELRLTYDLAENSLVFDLGGYEGQWASDIFGKYKCPVWIFEPSASFYQRIVARFSHNPSMKVLNFGLADHDGELKLYESEDASSVIRDKDSVGKYEYIRLVNASNFLSEKGIERIDLMKINIEGAEYDLLDHLIETGWITKIVNLQVQFHNFTDNAEARMQSIQRALARTHKPTYQYKFVWENWTRK